MSYAGLVEFENNVASNQQDYSNSWGGAARIWDAIWKKYGKRRDQYDGWLSAASDGRLWKLWKTEPFTECEKLVYLFTCDNALVAKDDFSKLASALREFATANPCNGVCHLLAFADFIEASKADAIGLYATSVCENPWWEWSEELEDSIPYDITKGQKHWWISERMEECIESE